MAALNQETAQELQLLRFRQAMMNQIRASQGVENMTATGAMIAAHQQSYMMQALAEDRRYGFGSEFLNRVMGGIFEG
jgi:hypothetical protein